MILKKAIPTTTIIVGGDHNSTMAEGILWVRKTCGFLKILFYLTVKS